MLHGNLTGFNAFTPAVVGGASYIQSKQDFSITIGSGASSNTATISTVDTTKSVLVVSGFSTSVATRAGTNMMPRVELTNSTTVTAIRSGTSNTITIYGHVIEFISSAVSSIQTGTIALNAVTSNTATITSVDTSRSVLFFYGTSSTETNTNPNTYYGGVTLTNATTVTANLGTVGTQTTTFGYAVLEFASGLVNSIQYVAATATGTGATYTATISSIDTSKYMISYCGEASSNATYTHRHTAVLTNSTTVTFTRTAATSMTRTMYLAVVEFVSGVLNQATQAVTTTLASVATNTSTITSVNTTKAVVMHMGWNTANTGDPRLVYMTAQLSNATTLQVDSNLAGTISRTAQNNVIEFA